MSNLMDGGWYAVCGGGQQWADCRLQRLQTSSETLTARHFTRRKRRRLPKLRSRLWQTPRPINRLTVSSAPFKGSIYPQKLIVVNKMKLNIKHKP